MTSEPADWNLYRSFLAVLQEGSLSAAARALGSTQPSMGRHIAALEAQLGAPLFVRAPDGLKPTALAQALEAPAQAMASAVRHAHRLASGVQAGQGVTLRLTASHIMGAEVLPDILARFQATHPDVTLELVLNNRSEDLLQHEADIAVRMTRPTQQALVSKRLGRIAIGLFAHKRYVQAHGLPHDLPGLAAHTLIGPDEDPFALRLGEQIGVPLRREMFQFRCDSDLAQIAALRAGMGIGGCHLGIARRHPDLLPVLADALTFHLDMWLLMHEDLRRSRPAMALYRFLARELQVYVLGSQR
jgi:DNA-binding transcriptional LysR family regulator